MGAAPRLEMSSCPFVPVVELVFGRWTSHVLWVLEQQGPLRFNALRDQVPGITPKVLTERLRKLERDGFVVRTQYPEIPPRVEYGVTDLARSLVPALDVLASWSSEHMGEVLAAQQAFDAVQARA